MIRSIVAASPPAPDDVWGAITKGSGVDSAPSKVVSSQAWTLGALVGASNVSAGQARAVVERGNRYIAFDGALFNKPELRRTLGLPASDWGDEEIVLMVYEKVGASFVEYLDGAYAYVIADGDELIFGVDHLGIKPLYTSSLSGGMFVTSTVELAPSQAQSSLRRVLPNAVWTRGGPLHQPKPYTLQRDWRQHLADAVHEQLPATAPYGCLLSGGLDSSVLARLVSRHGQILTFACGTEGSEDMEAAAVAAKHLGSTHHEVVIDESSVRRLAVEVVGLTASFESWLVLGGIGTLAVCRAVADFGLDVLLSGEGADELFAGYRDFDLVPGDKLESSLRVQQEQLGATECLRLDRCSRAAGIELRVPFLSRGVVQASRQLPVSAKRSTPGSSGGAVKVALREYAHSLGLPPSITNRPKIGFSAGSGVAGPAVLAAMSEPTMWASRRDLERFRGPGLDMTSPLAAWLLGLWLDQFGESLGHSWADLSNRGLVRG